MDGHDKEHNGEQQAPAPASQIHGMAVQEIAAALFGRANDHDP